MGYGETTTDGEFTLLPVTCQGACDKAPVMLVDGELAENMDEEKVSQIIASNRQVGVGD